MGDLEGKDKILVVANFVMYPFYWRQETNHLRLLPYFQRTPQLDASLVIRDCRRNSVESVRISISREEEIEAICKPALIMANVDRAPSGEKLYYTELRSTRERSPEFLFSVTVWSLPFKKNLPEEGALWLHELEAIIDGEPVIVLLALTNSERRIEIEDQRPIVIGDWITNGLPSVPKPL